MKLCLVILILLISYPCLAQHGGTPFVDFEGDFSSDKYNNTDAFNGPGVLGASDITIQDAFQTLDSSGVTVITACETSDDFCFKVEAGQLVLYVSGVRQVLF